MNSKVYFVDRAFHWISVFILLFMLLNLSSNLHNIDWDIKGQLLHRQSAVETHASVGIILVIFTLLRLMFSWGFKKSIQRVTPKSKIHAWFISFTHIAMYLCIFLLTATGIAMVNNYEIPLSIFGFELAPSRENFYQNFPQFNDIHIFTQQAFWWLIGCHFFGILHAKK
ncbi:cytochrome b/b6 domain-containing protein [Pseudoalteromonas rubra]|uniref:Cytochrome b561 bacterial/Ni-hydrogenase domain-containing protein n=2 Tax=Pseudoalteromonas rubra TaxID=43658 RepID=A0A4Q7EQS2_9GAMM|nr:cytochrome b/b6 domain-containing protein [Pseudoalteromonas rubra]RZM84345.1 hypothetical protein C3B51_04320 [Pseudoalteromonas rubra]